MKLDVDNGTSRTKSDFSGESRAFTLLETVRLRCESLIAGFGQREHLVAIHREVGLAGYVTSAEFSPEHRSECLELAVRRLGEDPVPSSERLAAEPPQIGRTLARMFSETISASDALAGELAANDADNLQRDRLHLVHAHVMSACELLDERLTVLELEGTGIDSAR